MTARAWCFTLNNPMEEDSKELAECAYIKYICWGKETGENGTPHFQGYIEMTKPMRITGIKKLGQAFARMHLEARKGTREQARDYCAKGQQPHEEWENQGTKGPNYGRNAEFVEHGDWSISQGARTDLHHIKQIALDEGMRGVTAESKSAQQLIVAEKFLTYHEEPRDWKPTVMWLWGPTGVGKSRKAREVCDTLDTYTKSDGTKWWPGYDRHTAVIIDDFRDSWWPITEMLSLLDRYEKRVECKGGYRQFNPTTIVVTSCSSPASCYRGTGECVKQLLRRIDLTLELRNEDGDHSKAPIDETSCNEVSRYEVEEGNTLLPRPQTISDKDVTDILKELAGEPTSSGTVGTE